MIFLKKKLNFYIFIFCLVSLPYSKLNCFSPILKEASLNQEKVSDSLAKDNELVKVGSLNSSYYDFGAASPNGENNILSWSELFDGADLQEPGKIDSFEQEEKDDDFSFNGDMVKTAERQDFDYEFWRKRCLSLPTPDEIQAGFYGNKALEKEEFFKSIEECIAAVRASSASNGKNWIGENLFEKEAIKGESVLGCQDGQAGFEAKVPESYIMGSIFKNIKTSFKSRDPRFFVQKIDCQEADFYVHADIHGDIHSLIKFFDGLYYGIEGQKKVIDKNFKLIDKNSYIVLLGDYVDRVGYGAEVLFTIAKLKAANPENVILIRGNHESEPQNEVCGLHKELFSKFCEGSNTFYEKEKILNLLNDFYNCMPVALFASVFDSSCKQKNYTLFCHGGIDFGFDPNDMLSSGVKYQYKAMKRGDYSWIKGSFLDELDESGIIPDYEIDSNLSNLAFLWGDFRIKSNKKSKSVARGPKYSSVIAKYYISICSCKEKGYSLKSIIRGHQHNGKFLLKMLEHGGCLKLWENDNLAELRDKKIFGEGEEKSFDLNLESDFSVLTLISAPGCIYAKSFLAQKDLVNFCQSLEKLKAQKIIMERLKSQLEKDKLESFDSKNSCKKEEIKKSDGNENESDSDESDSDESDSDESDSDDEEAMQETNLILVEKKLKSLEREILEVNKNIEAISRFVSARYNYDTHAKFSMSGDPKNWKITIFQKPVYVKC